MVSVTPISEASPSSSWGHVSAVRRDSTTPSNTVMFRLFTGVKRKHSASGNAIFLLRACSTA